VHGSTCKTCGGKNHWTGSQFCRSSKKVHFVRHGNQDLDIEAYSSDSEVSEFDDTCIVVKDVQSVTKKKHGIFCKMHVNGNDVDLKLIVVQQCVLYLKCM